MLYLKIASLAAIPASMKGMKRPADFMVAPRETIAGPGHMPATKTRVIFF